MNAGKKLLYFRLTAREAFLSLPRFFLAFALTAAVFLAGAFILSRQQQSQDLLPRLDVAVVTEKGDLATGLSARVVEAMESVQSVARFVYMSSEDADKAFASGQVPMVVYLPKNIYQNIDSGKNTPVRVRFSFDSGYAGAFFRELLDTGVSILRTGEAAVYSVDAVSVTYELRESLGQTMTRLAGVFMSAALNRGALFENRLLDAYGPVPLWGSFVILALLAFLGLLFTPAFAFLYSPSGETARICLKREGIGRITRAVARIFSMTLVFWVILAVLVPIMARFFDGKGFSAWLPILCFLPALSIAAFIHLLFSLLPAAGRLIACLVILLLTFLLGGGLLSFSSPVLRQIAAFLPVSRWRAFLTDLVWNGVRRETLVPLLLCTAVLLLGGIFAARLRKEASL